MHNKIQIQIFYKKLKIIHIIHIFLFIYLKYRMLKLYKLFKRTNITLSNNVSKELVDVNPVTQMFRKTANFTSSVPPNSNKSNRCRSNVGLILTILTSGGVGYYLGYENARKTIMRDAVMEVINDKIYEYQSKNKTNDPNSNIHHDIDHAKNSTNVLN
jgi:hypothetical protein